MFDAGERIIPSFGVLTTVIMLSNCSVEDINSALFMNKIEPVYGLSMHNAAQLEPTTDMAVNSSKTVNKQTSRLVNLGIAYTIPLSV